MRVEACEFPVDEGYDLGTLWMDEDVEATDIAVTERELSVGVELVRGNDPCEAVSIDTEATRRNEFPDKAAGFGTRVLFHLLDQRFEPHHTGEVLALIAVEDVLHRPGLDEFGDKGSDLYRNT